MIRPARFPRDLEAVRGLFRDYEAALGISLEFQGFDRELAGLPGAYAPPEGRLLLAWQGGEGGEGGEAVEGGEALEGGGAVEGGEVAESSGGAVEGGEAVGCVALRPLEQGFCEMKRLYVRPTARTNGLGRVLAERICTEARSAGYLRMRLDTLASMAAARRLYAGLGFRPIPAYCFNPLPDAVFLELDLSAKAR